MVGEIQAVHLAALMECSDKRKRIESQCQGAYVRTKSTERTEVRAQLQAGAVTAESELDAAGFISGSVTWCAMLAVIRCVGRGQ